MSVQGPDDPVAEPVLRAADRLVVDTTPASAGVHAAGATSLRDTSTGGAPRPRRAVAALRLLADVVLGVVPGLVAFFWLYRPILDPRKEGWVFADFPATLDTAASGMGWIFYNNDGWHWPLVSDPRYGRDLANSLLFSDTVPAFALPMKVLSHLFGRYGTTQIIGVGLLFCFVMQSLLGFALVRSTGGSRLLALIGAAFFSTVPFLVNLWSINSLYWQWVILAGLLILVREMSARSRTTSWVLLVFVATGVSPYYAAMLVVMGLADHVARGLVLRSWRWLLSGSAATVAALFVGGYFWGAYTLGFSSASTTAADLGVYAASDLALVDSSVYSRLLPDLAGGSDSGFAFVGTGVLALLVVAVVLSLARLRSPAAAARGLVQELRRPGVAAVLVSCLVLAVGSTLPFVDHPGGRWRLPLPGPVVTGLTVFRANGRFVWPLAYLTVLAGVVLVPRLVRRRSPAVRWGATALVAVALGVQLYDLKAALTGIRDGVRVTATHTPEMQQQLHPIFAAPGVRAVEMVLAFPDPTSSPWREVGLAAHNASLDLQSAGYFNRYDVDVIIRLRDEQVKRMQEHRLREDTVYVVSPDYYTAYLKAWAPARVLLTIDGYLVVRVTPEAATS